MMGISFKETNSCDGVEGCVSADAEVGSRDIVGDCSRDDHDGNAHLLIFFSCLNQLQASNIGLQIPREKAA